MMFYCVATVLPSVSGLLDFDYPSLSDPKIGLGSIKELGDVRRVPLPVELVEQFGRILGRLVFSAQVFPSDCMSHLVTVNTWYLLI